MPRKLANSSSTDPSPDDSLATSQSTLGRSWRVSTILRTYASWIASTRRVEGEHLKIVDRRGGNPVDVVPAVERVALDVIRRWAEVEPPTVEQQHADVDPGRTSCRNPITESAEVALVELIEIESGLSVLGRTRSGSRPRLRRHVEVVVPACCLGPELLPPPEPDEVVAALGQELEITLEVESLGLVRILDSRSHPVLQVVPDVRAGEVDRPAGGRTGAMREIARIDLRHDERSGIGRNIRDGHVRA